MMNCVVFSVGNASLGIQQQGIGASTRRALLRGTVVNDGLGHHRSAPSVTVVHTKDLPRLQHVDSHQTTVTQDIHTPPDEWGLFSGSS